METGATGGGVSFHTHEETVTITGNNTYTINCGFRPKNIFCAVTGGNNYTPVRAVYWDKMNKWTTDNGYTNTKCLFNSSGDPASTTNAGISGIPASGASIQEITDTGFTYKCTTSWGSGNFSLYVYADDMEY